MQILQGNNLPLLKLMPDNSVDSIVTDPPYGLKFMGKKWDYDVPQVELELEYKQLNNLSTESADCQRVEHFSDINNSIKLK